MAQFIGNRITSATQDSPDTSWADGRMLAFDFGALLLPPSTGWITRIGGWVRQPIGLTLSSRIEWGLFERLSSGFPGRLIARTSLLNVPDSPSNGANVEGSIVWINDEYKLGGKTTSPMAVRVAAGQQFLIGALTNYYVQFVTNGSVTMSAFHRAEGSDHLVNPYGSPLSPAPFLSHKRYAVYYVFEDSAPPTVGLTSPAASATIPDNTPTFTGTFTDTDAANFGDFFFAYEIEVRRQSDGLVYWNAATSQALTNAAEQSSKTFSKIYTGTTLPAGIPLEWRARVQDYSGEWSAYPAWRVFSIASLGFVSVATTAIPSGHVDGDPSVIDWSARWYHTANLGANRVQLRVLDANSAVIRPGVEVVTSVAGAQTEPGTQFTIQDTEAVISPVLPQGQALKWQIRGRDTNGIWSDWSPAVDFRTNAVPTVPQPISPASASVHTSPPILIAASEDIDTVQDPPLSGVVWDVETTEIATTTVRTALATAYDPATKQASRMADATLAPNFGAYSWRMRGRDVSAGAFGISAWGPSRTFTLSDGPVVTITAPTEGEVRETTALRVQWMTSEAQTSYLVQIYTVVNGVVATQIDSSGIVLSATQFYDVPVGKLQNNTSYMVKVTVTNAVNQTGVSQERRFRVFFTGAQALASLLGSVVARFSDVEPTTPQLTWAKTLYSTNEFRAYIVKRWETAKGEATAVTLVEITNPNQLTFFDYHAPPNVGMTYGVSQRIQAGSNTLVSPDVNVQLSFVLTVPLVVSRRDPANVRFPFMWLNQDYGGTVEPIQAEYTTWEASGLPTIVGANGGPETRQIGITIRTDQYGSMISKYHRIKAAVKTNHQVSLRDESELLFMAMKRLRWRRGRVPGTRTIQIELKETSFRERATI